MEAIQSIMRALAVLEVMGIGPHSDEELLWGAAHKLWNVVEAEIELNQVHLQEIKMSLEDGKDPWADDLAEAIRNSEEGSVGDVTAWIMDWLQDHEVH